MCIHRKINDVLVQQLLVLRVQIGQSLRQASLVMSHVVGRFGGGASGEVLDVLNKTVPRRYSVAPYVHLSKDLYTHFTDGTRASAEHIYARRSTRTNRPLCCGHQTYPAKVLVEIAQRLLVIENPVSEHRFCRIDFVLPCGASLQIAAEAALGWLDPRQCLLPRTRARANRVIGLLPACNKKQKQTISVS